MNDGNIECSCDECGMEFSISVDAAEDLTCPLCQEPVSIGDSNELEEEWDDLDEDQDDDEDPRVTGAALAG